MHKWQQHKSMNHHLYNGFLINHSFCISFQKQILTSRIRTKDLFCRMHRIPPSYCVTCHHVPSDLLREETEPVMSSNGPRRFPLWAMSPHVYLPWHPIRHLNTSVKRCEGSSSRCGEIRKFRGESSWRVYLQACSTHLSEVFESCTDFRHF